MDFDKATLLANLKTLQGVIMTKYKMITGDPNINPLLIEEVKNDYYFVTGLIDDIVRERITEFPLVERTNMVSGRTFLEEPGTPPYLSPACEAYWSM